MIIPVGSAPPVTPATVARRRRGVSPVTLLTVASHNATSVVAITSTRSIRQSSALHASWDHTHPAARRGHAQCAPFVRLGISVMAQAHRPFVKEGFTLLVAMTCVISVAPTTSTVLRVPHRAPPASQGITLKAVR